jgi:hypothetical protein
MQAIWSGPHSEGWKKSGAQIYGWMNAGCYVSTSHKSRYVAPWVGEPDAKPTFNGYVIYQWQERRDNHYACLNSLNSGKYAYNNLQSVYYTWYRKFGNSSPHTATERWYMWGKKVPNVGPSARPCLPCGVPGTKKSQFTFSSDAIFFF